MTTELNTTALAVFVFFFVLVTVMGFVATHWRRPKTLAHIDEWGLGGRSFGIWITWFLVGGDFYTAYTVIAVRRWSIRLAPTVSSRCPTPYCLSLRLHGHAAPLAGGERLRLRDRR